MSDRVEILEPDREPPTSLACLGLVVHPSRSIDRPLNELRRWATANAVQLVQVPTSSPQQQVADSAEPDGCDLIVSLGGDGTTLAALRAAVGARRPVLAVACGSLGVLTSIPSRGIVESIERFRRNDWVPHVLPALDVKTELEPDLFALNDIAVVRAGTGQVRVTATVDDEVFARLAGDGCVVSMPVGSSAYTLAAGGPLVMPDIEALVFTPLPAHGGTIPPIVLGAGSTLRLDVRTSQGRARLEVDGQVRGDVSGSLAMSYRRAVATLVTLSGQAPLLSVLRDRRIISDSPRILAEEAAIDRGGEPPPA